MKHLLSNLGPFSLHISRIINVCIFFCLQIVQKISRSLDNNNWHSFTISKISARQSKNVVEYPHFVAKRYITLWDWEILHAVQ